MNPFRLLPSALVVALVATAAPVRADTLACTEIASLPATIAAQGVYCLKKPLVLAAPGAYGITVGANNVTIDCNGNQLSATATVDRGILAVNRQNVTIRNCVVAGFNVGIHVGGSGHLVEDNTTIRSRSGGIQSYHGPSVVRRNFVVRTGDVAGASYPTGIAISGSVDVLDNTVAGVSPLAGSVQSGRGISVQDSDDGELAGNRIWGITGDGVARPTGINIVNSPGLSVRDNEILALDGLDGIRCTTPGDAMVTDNFAAGFSSGSTSCTADDNQSVE